MVKNTKKSYKRNKFKITAATCNDKIELSDGSFSVSNIEDYFEYIIKKHEAVTDTSPKRRYVHKTENRITFKIKTRHYLQLSTPEMMKLLGSPKNKITKDNNEENVPHLEINKVVLVHCYVVNNDCHLD